MTRTWLIAYSTRKSNGKTYEYEYIDKWGRRYYSFDGGDTMFTSKSEAFRLATKLREVNRAEINQ